MIKSELISVIANQQKGISEETAARAVNYIIKLLASSMAAGKRIEIRDFGSLDLRIQKQRQARNPRTGAVVITKTKRKPHFKAGKELKDILNGVVAKNSIRAVKEEEAEAEAA